MTALERLLARQIAQTGPIPIAEYMAACLGHPDHGYYATRDPFGQAGDFVTAPEISQMFGELVGLALAQAWQDLGAPGTVLLVELGPGRGTLMADLLRATARVPGFHTALSLHLVETSPTLRALQSETLAGAAPVWHDGIDTLPEGPPILVVANEFFDALPIRQFSRAGPGWRERLVGCDTTGRLVPGWAASAPFAGLDHRRAGTRDGDIVETCAPGAAIAAALGRRISDCGGAALLIDYGDWCSLGDTFQAVRQHAPVDPFEAPGTADLTAQVDFEALARAASPARHSRLTPQGIFLERLGITERARILARGRDAQANDRVVAAHRRLTHPDEMGSLFKVMGLYGPDSPPLPGLDP